MKIVAVETTLLTIPYQTSGGLQFIAGRPAAGLNMVLVRLETDAGITGWGEAFGHAVARGTKTVMDTLVAPLLIGRDPADIAGLMLDLQRKLHLLGRNGPVMYALSGVDIALWDIAGKARGLPVYRLLGGEDRRSLPAYTSLLRCSGPDTVASACAEKVENGFKFIKLHEITVEAVKAARQAIGETVELMVDTNCPWTLDDALKMQQAFEPYRLFWLEEPLWPPEDYEALATLRKAGAPTSCGENAGGILDFRRMFELGAVAYAQPSVSKIGGISEMQKIVALGRGYGVPVIPHCGYLGAGFLATLHVTAALPEETLVERLNVDLEDNPYSPWNEIVRGRASVPQGPGLGCDPDPKVMARYRTHEPSVVR